MNRIFFLFFFLSYSLGIAQIGFPQNIIIDNSFGIIYPNIVLGRDLNNDGKKDMLAVSDSKILWNKNTDFLNGFAHPVLIYNHTSKVVSIEAKDLNADGKIDIIFNANNGLFLMKGTGSVPAFENPVLLTSATNVTFFNILDIDGDGDLDVYWHQSNGAFLKKNDGNGNFLVIQTVFSPFPPVVMALKDLDNDNKPDILIKSAGYKLQWYKNDGAGNFTLKQTIDLDAFSIVADAGDIDGDGDIDILSLYENGVETKFIWYSNLNGSGNFSGPMLISAVPYIVGNNQNALLIDGKYRLKLIDIDNDNKPDLVFSVYWNSKLSWKKNLGNGNFGTEQIINSNVIRIMSFDVADFNGDSKLDIVSASLGDDKLAWCQNMDGLGNFSSEKIITTSISNANKVAAGDLDGDGYRDVIVTSTSDNKISWYKNINGLGDFSGLQKIIRNNFKYATDVLVADFDGDGDNDIAVRYEYNVVSSTFSRISWLENDGTGNFPVEHTVLEGITQNQMVFDMSYGDFDNDGDIDLVTIASGNNVSWYKNNGAGFFAAPQRFSPVEYKYGNTVISADMDGDGDLDIAVASSDDIEWYENNGQGNFTIKHTVAGQVSNTKISVGDVDGDGDNDILFLHYGASTIGWYENLGQGNFGPKKIVDINPGIYHPKSLMAFDVDGDGNKDIVANSNTASKLRWYKSNGNGTFGSAAIITNNIGRVKSMLGADLNGDGLPELVAVSDVGENIDEQTMLTWFETKTASQNKIKGKVRYDIDNNGCDANDISASMIMVSTQSPTHKYSTFTDANGGYSLIAKQGQYNTFIDTSLPGYTISPQNHGYNFTATGVTDIADFCIAPNQVYKDIEISIYPVLTARPGFDTKYKMIINNKGTQKVSGDISFAYNAAKMNFLQASSPAVSQTNGNVSFNYQDLSPFQTKTIELKFNVLPMPANNIGDQLHINGVANVVGDVTPSDNEFALHQTIVGAYDPNDITVLEGSQILLQDADEYLHYIIRFQNTGNHFAEKVKVHNVLDSKLDGSTLVLEAYSHSNEAKIINENDIEFNFNAIYLSGTNDEPNSHGFIAYKVKPKSNVQINDIINNVADIYFDYNPAIVTNTVSTKIVNHVLGTNEQVKNTMKIYPNPTTGIVNLNTHSVPEKIEIYNALGQKVKVFQNVRSIDISDLTIGIYTLIIFSKNEGLATIKIVKK